MLIWSKNSYVPKAGRKKRIDKCKIIYRYMNWLILHNLELTIMLEFHRFEAEAAKLHKQREPVKFKTGFLFTPQSNLKPDFLLIPQSNLKPVFLLTPQSNIKPVFLLIPQSNFKPDFLLTPLSNFKREFLLIPLGFWDLMWLHLKLSILVKYFWLDFHLLD